MWTTDGRRTDGRRTQRHANRLAVLRTGNLKCAKSETHNHIFLFGLGNATVDFVATAIEVITVL